MNKNCHRNSSSKQQASKQQRAASDDDANFFLFRWPGRPINMTEQMSIKAYP